MTNVFDLIDSTKDKQNRKIQWEKWFDPLGDDIEEREWPGAIGTFRDDKKLEDYARKKKVLAGQLPPEYSDDDYTPFAVSGEYNAKKSGMSNLKVITTALGVLAITEHNRAGNMFNFWVAHTNFRLTSSIVEIIEKTDGVESLDLYTPYRCRIGIGKIFDSTEVKQSLLSALKAEESKIA